MINARYTVVLKSLLDDPTFKPKIDQALSDYPLYVSKNEHEYIDIPNLIPTREELNKKLLDAYKYREIGFETPGRFLDELQIAMKEIMPKYNQLFFTTDQDFNVIYNVDYKRTIDTNRTGTNQNTNDATENQTGQSSSTTEGSNQSSANDRTTTSASVENYNKNIKSDTPQGQLGLSNTEIDQVEYANEAQWNHDSNSDQGTTTGQSSTNSSSSLEGTTQNQGQTTSHATMQGQSQQDESTLETTKGNFGVVSAQDLIAKYREIIINVVQELINDPRIKELFMKVF